MLTTLEHAAVARDRPGDRRPAEPAAHRLAGPAPPAAAAPRTAPRARHLDGPAAAGRAGCGPRSRRARCRGTRTPRGRPSGGRRATRRRSQRCRDDQRAAQHPSGGDPDRVAPRDEAALHQRRRPAAPREHDRVAEVLLDHHRCPGRETGEHRRPKADRPARRTAARVSAIDSITSGAAKISPSASWRHQQRRHGEGRGDQGGPARAARRPTTWCAAHAGRHHQQHRERRGQHPDRSGGQPVSTANR